MEENLQVTNDIVKRDLNYIGILLGFFFNIIGLFAGIFLYKEDIVKREIMLKGWIKGFLALFALAVFFLIIYVIIVY